MPLYTPDPSKVQVALEIFDKGDYAFQIGEPKAFNQVKKDAAGNPVMEDVGGGQLKEKSSYGVRYSIVCQLPDTHKGKRQIQTCYIHTDGAFGFAKQFIMACLGFNPRDAKSEREFDSKFTHADWGVNTDSGAVGDMWREVNGKIAIASLDIGQNPNDGSPTQVFKSWRPAA